MTANPLDISLMLRLVLWGCLIYVGVLASLVAAGIAAARSWSWWQRDEMDEEQARVFGAYRPSGWRRVQGFVFEVAMATCGVTIRTLWMLRLLPDIQDPGRGTPIVLLPGYTEDPGTMWFLARRLHRRGFRPFLLGFPSTFSSIDKNVAFLGRELNKIAQKTGHERIAVVAHSMGGVVTRSLMLSDPDHRVLTLVALSSPFRGTHIAKLGAAFGLGESTVDMSPGSPFAHRFSPSARATAPIHVIIGEQENIVSPPWSSVLPGSDTHLVSLPVGHDAPLYMRETYERIEAWLLADGVLRVSEARVSRVSHVETEATAERLHPATQESPSQMAKAP